MVSEDAMNCQNEKITNRINARNIKQNISYNRWSGLLTGKLVCFHNSDKNKNKTKHTHRVCLKLLASQAVCYILCNKPIKKKIKKRYDIVFIFEKCNAFQPHFYC